MYLAIELAKGFGGKETLWKGFIQFVPSRPVYMIRKAKESTAPEL